MADLCDGGGSGAASQRGALVGDFVELFGDEARNNVGAYGCVVAAVIEEADGKWKEVVAGDTIELGTVGGEVLVTGGDGGDVDQDQTGAGGVLAAILVDEDARVVATAGVGDGRRRVAGGARWSRRRKEAVVNGDQVFFGAKVRKVEPNILDAVEGAEAGGVAGKRDCLLRMVKQDTTGILAIAMTEQLKKTFRIDGPTPCVVLGLKAVRA